MIAILGAAGKIGSATARVLREAGIPVRAVLRNAGKARALQAVGCDIAYADLKDPEALSRAIAGAEAVQVVVPPQPQAEDMGADLRQTFESLATAIERSRPELVLAISDYGAHLGGGAGIPSLFHEMEERFRRLPSRRIFLRSAEHMENWARHMPAVIATGNLQTLMAPIDRQFPTVSAHEVGLVAADLLLQADNTVSEQIAHVEGPRRYCVADVADAIGVLLGRGITAEAVPRPEWQERLARVMQSGTVRLMMELHDVHNRGLIDIEPDAGRVFHGRTELIDALRPLLPRT